MNQWFRFFFGTPRRFLTTLTVIGMIIVVIQPGLLRLAGERLVNELSPLLGPVLAIIIIFAGIRLILFGRR
jgi:uncharacterized protein YaaW (UPF0174 family)